MGDEVCLSFYGSGNLDVGSRVDELYSYQSHRGADMLELFAIDYSYKAIKTTAELRGAGDEDGPAQT